MLALARPTEAKIVYTRANRVIKAHHYYQLDLNHDKKIDFTISNAATCATDECFYRLLQKPAAGNSGINVFKGYVLASALKRGSRIGPGRHFSDQTAAMVGIDSAYPFNYVFGQWVNVQRRYLGLRFKIKGQTHYGWARLNVRVVLPPHSAITAVLTGYAYETIPNRPILAGKTKGPDVTTVSPASLGHLAAGASAIPALRTRSP